MQTGYYSATAGMVAQFNRLDTIANNLANVNTIGYKEDDVVIGDFTKLLKEARDELPIENHTKDGAKFINRAMTKAPHIVEGFTDHSVGQLQSTSNALDFALTKEGLFFAVKTPAGIRLTRDGAFTKDDDGKLVTKEGYEVLDNSPLSDPQTITFNNQENSVVVDSNGQIHANIPNEIAYAQNSKFFIAQPDNLKLLQKDGDNLYKYPNIESLTNIEESRAVKQGFVEKSNVNAVKMMTQMIETNRLVEMYQKAMSSQMDDMNSEAINKIAKKA